ncbi:DUF2958 domain-containing protein [Novosphingobium sp. SG720]|uniref:DUF2958 domain-containing protein n=1 Tax=Novosphingobium sp. SG720 TaxID=2586998 RepID=UPI001446A894|nr:DUF2958 domain-containing protein [Novosphingobium sp. SG720]NKJ44864.1 hypothetical protein [Novosphingobium sp. SG720]
MIVLTPELHAALRRNAERSAETDHDPAPVVKLFSPIGAATWLATELLDDGDTLFGLADLGFGCPELGYFSLGEIARLHLPFGLTIERDIGFSTSTSLSVWADTARRAGSIREAQSILWRIESAPGPELPTDPEEGNGG